MDLGLDGRVVVVSGGAKGIGAACVETFLAEGAFVAVVDKDAEAGSALAAATASDRLSIHVGDLCDDEVCKQAIGQIVGQFGRLDVLVNNAGVNDSIALDQPSEKFVASLRRNLLPAYQLTHHGLPHLKASMGAIVNVGSKVSVTGQGGTSGYAAAKGGLNGLTREWAAELAMDNVRVNAVLPAECDTDLYRSWLARLPDPAGARIAIERRIPLGRRLTHPREVAAMVVFLASAMSSHTTGQLIFVDGGYTHLDRALTS
jgi:L-fucose dehydrogenase